MTAQPLEARIRTQFGLALVPFGNPDFDHAWLQPKPKVASWRAARGIGLTDLRLQFNVGVDKKEIEVPVSPIPGAWNPALFRAFIEPAFAAGMRINANFVVGQPAPHHDLLFYEEMAYRLVRAFGHMIYAYSFGNEWGYEAQTWEAENPGHDYLEEVYGPRCVAFVRGIRRANLFAWITGSDAESAETQMKYMLFANRVRLETGLILFNEHGGHPYGMVADGKLDYATVEGANGKLGFIDVVKADPLHRRLGFPEIDNQQFDSAIGRGEKFGPAARVLASDQELLALIQFTRLVGARGDIACLYFGSEGFFFERGKRADNGLPCNSFYLAEPVISWSGNMFAAEFAKVNGPASPVSGGQQGRHRAGAKP